MAKLDSQKDLGEILREEGVISAEQLEAVREMQKTREKPLSRVIVDMGLISENAKIQLLRERFHYELVDLHELTVPTVILTRLSRSFAEKHRCVPILIEDGQLVVAMSDPTDIVVLDEIKGHTGMPPMPVLATQSDIDLVLGQYPHLTQAQVDALRLRITTHPLWWRIVHPVLFFLVMIAPLAIFGFGVWAADNWIATTVQGLTRDKSSFDLSLYVVLGWALWAIVLWEMDGLIFRKNTPPDESPSS